MCVFSENAQFSSEYSFNKYHLGSKIDDLWDICSRSTTDVLRIDETKLDSSYPDPQLKTSGYQYPPYRKDRNKYGGKIVFLREGLTARGFRDFGRDTTETICLELTISKKIWFIIFSYRPPISYFFQQ